MFNKILKLLIAVAVVENVVLLAPGSILAAEQSKRQERPFPSDMKKIDNATGRILPLYEWADDEVLQSEQQRLKIEKAQLNKKKKELKKKKKALKREIKALEKQVEKTQGAKSAAIEKEIAKKKSEQKQLAAELKITGGHKTVNRIQRKRAKNFMITPFAAPSYTPEMGFLLAGGGLASFKTRRLDPKLQRSSINAMGGWGTSGAGMAYVKLVSFWAEDWLRIVSENWFKAMNDNYWGAGYSAAAKYDSPNSHTKYHRTWWSADLQVLAKLGVKDLYGGLNAVFNQTVATNVNADMKQDPDYMKYGSNNYNGGLGVILTYDTRDVTINAFKGLYLNAGAVFFGKYMGGKNNYQIFTLDYRQYIPLGKFKGNTLAWQLKSRIGTGDVPWAELSQPGNPFDLRGYQWGRFRDKTSVVALIEYRLQIKRIHRSTGESELSPHGIVVWTGTGSIGETFADMTRWMPNVGVGYRLELQPRMNVRVDWGFGMDNQALYVNFLEAF
jgi:hypothetical protein